MMVLIAPVRMRSIDNIQSRNLTGAIKTIMRSSQNSYRSFRRILCLTLVILCAVVSALAQTTTSTITGEFKDEGGAVLAGVQVTARHNETGLVRTTISTDDGRVVFSRLPLGA